jgi:uncharacterized protein
VLSGELKTPELERLSELLHADRHSTVRVSLCFKRGPGGQVLGDLHYKATLYAVCQRCLEPAEQRIDATVAWAFVGSESEVAAILPEFEVLVLEDERLQPATLVEDELILALPMIPRHSTVDACGALAQNLRNLDSDRDAERLDSTLEGH